MADKPNAAPATAGVTSTTGSGADAAPSTVRAPSSLPEFLSSDRPFDVEDMLAGPEETAPSETKPNPGPTDEGTPAEPEVEIPPTDTEVPPEDNNLNADDDNPEILEDTTGKRLVAAKDFKRMHRQRDEAKQAAAEAKRRAEAAEAKAAELENQLRQSQDQPVPVQSSTNPLARITNPAALDAEVQRVKAIIDWCRTNPEGGTLPAKLVGGTEGEDLEDRAAVAHALRWAEDRLEAVPKQREFLSAFSQTRAKVRAENPQMFVAGTPEHKAAQSWQSKLLNFGTAPDQDIIIARLLKLDRMEQEEADGIASYARVPKKPTSEGQQQPDDKPKPKPLQITTKPVSVKPAAGQPGAPRSIEEKLQAAQGPVDIEELFAA